MTVDRTYRAGAAIEDFCRVCKMDRQHTVVAADAEGQPLRVRCDYCRSEHNYRGGPRSEQAGSHPATTGRTAGEPEPVRQFPAAGTGGRRGSSRDPFPSVSDRERVAPVVGLPDGSTADLELLLRRIIREESGLTAAVPADRWRNGMLVLKPGVPGLQEKAWPIETFFHKIVMLRNRLRTLEQQINGSELTDDAKVKLQGYISGCYGSLTSFNVLFADDADQFKGS